MKTDLSPKDLAAKLGAGEKMQIIDVRSPEEFQTGHLPGARNVPLETIADQIPGVRKDEAFVLVCHGGARSDDACRRIASSYDSVYILSGGMSAWERQMRSEARTEKPGMGVDRQTHLVAGIMVLSGLVLSSQLGPGWIVLTILPGFGMLLHALTGLCPMTLFLGRLPWNASCAAPRNV
ncbi:MAG TPA: rhodanese-like domain-containing protein [Fimbriimonas sp.]